MKIKINTNRLVNIVVIVFVAVYVGLIAFEMWDFHSINQNITTENDITNEITNNLKPIDPPISPDLPYRKHIALRDSIRNLRAFKNKNMFSASGVQFLYFIGTTGSYVLCDTCTVKYYGQQLMHGDWKNHLQYFLQLPGWQLKASANDYYNEDSVRFYEDHNHAFVRKQVVYKSLKNKHGGIYNYLRYVDVPVQFGYDLRGQCLLIPVSHAVKSTMDVLLAILMIAFAVYIYYMVATLIKFMVDISKGLAFTDKNVFRLKLIATTLIVFPLIIFLGNLLMRLLFNRYFTPDVVMNGTILEGWWKTAGTGIIFLLLFKAFRQGKLLKEEQELTV